MVRTSAKMAVSDVLHVELEERQSQELYYSICSFLMEKHELCYLNVIKFKYTLLAEDFNLELIDYFVMEYMLHKMKKYPLVLDTLTYLVLYKS